MQVEFKSARFAVSVLSVICFIGASLNAFAFARDKSVPAYSVQGDSMGAGRINILASTEGVRISIGSSGTYLVAAKPDWKVVVYNPTNKRGLSMSLAAWQKHLPDWNTIINDTDWLYLREIFFEKKGVAFGFPSSTYYIPAYRNRRVSPGTRIGSYEVIDTPDLSKECLNVVEKTLNVPVAQGLPTSLILMGKPVSERAKSTPFRMVSGNPSTQLKTWSAKKISCPLSTFAYPTNFQVVRTEREIMQDKKLKRDAEAMFGELFKDTGGR